MTDHDAKAKEIALRLLFGKRARERDVPHVLEDNGPWLICPVDLADAIRTYGDERAREAREAALREADEIASYWDDLSIPEEQ